MAAINEIITLGIGTPSGIPYFLLLGLGLGAAPVAAEADYVIAVRADVGTIRCRADAEDILVREDVETVEP